ncbi:MAG: hypothetical protein ACI8UO_005761 [Verrucomicrobiales bacterium]|jgi:hypothetical protein
MKYTTSQLSVAVLCVVSILSTANAALQPRDPENLDKAATLIVSGVATEVVASTRGTGRFVDSIATVEVKVESVSKGGAKVGESIKIRCWRPKTRPEGWAGPQGSGPIPAKGSQFKAWLRKGDDGVWESLEPNGISLGKGGAAFSFKKAKSSKPGFFRRLFGG